MRTPVLSALFLLACGDASDSQDTASPVETVTFSHGPFLDLVLREVVPVTVCIDGTDTCAQAGEDGMSIEVPRGERVVLTRVPDDPDYVSALGTVGPLEEDWDRSDIDYFVITEELATAMLEQMGHTWDDSAAVVTGFAQPPGTTVTLSGVEGQGPYYLGDVGLPDANLTATSSSGGYAFAEVGIGQAEITVSHDGLACNVATGPGTTDDTVSLPTRAGWSTGVPFTVCD